MSREIVAEGTLMVGLILLWRLVVCPVRAREEYE